MAYLYSSSPFFSYLTIHMREEGNISSRSQYVFLPHCYSSLPIPCHKPESYSYFTHRSENVSKNYAVSAVEAFIFICN
jgi:hypothetical protein